MRKEEGGVIGWMLYIYLHACCMYLHCLLTYSARVSERGYLCSEHSKIYSSSVSRRGYLCSELLCTVRGLILSLQM